MPDEAPISKTIKKRILDKKASFFANDNISAFIRGEEIEALKIEIEAKIQELLEILIIDTANDHNVQETSKRIAKMYIDEVFRGRYYPIPETKDYPNFKKLDELYVLGPITVRSTCSHHFVPVIGKAWVGVVPSERVVGISKFSRLLNWIMSRPQIQEEATVEIADLIEKTVSPKGVGVLVQAKHFCMHWRGVKEPATNMSTSVFRGCMKSNESLKKDFFQVIKSHGFGDFF